MVNAFRTHHRCVFSTDDVAMVIPPGLVYTLGEIEFRMSHARRAPNEAVIVPKAEHHGPVYGLEDVEVRPRLLSGRNCFREEHVPRILAMLSSPTPSLILDVWCDAVVARVQFVSLARRYWHKRTPGDDTNDFARRIATKFASQGGLCAYSTLPLSLTCRPDDPFRCEMSRKGTDLVCAALNVEIDDAQAASSYWNESIDMRLDLARKARDNAPALEEALQKWRRGYKRRRGS